MDALEPKKLNRLIIILPLSLVLITLVLGGVSINGNRNSKKVVSKLKEDSISPVLNFSKINEKIYLKQKMLLQLDEINNKKGLDQNSVKDLIAIFSDLDKDVEVQQKIAVGKTYEEALEIWSEKYQEFKIYFDQYVASKGKDISSKKELLNTIDNLSIAMDFIFENIKENSTAIHKEHEKVSKIAEMTLAITLASGLLLALLITFPIVGKIKNLFLSLAELQNDFENIFKSLSDMTFDIDVEGNILKINSKVMTLFEVDEKTISGLKIFDLVHFKTKEEKEEFSQIKDPSLRFKFLKSKKIPFGLSNELAFMCLLQVSRKADSTGRTTGYILSAVDIREELKIQEELAQSKKLASIGQLASGVGHEINNPLTIAIGNIRKISRMVKKDNFDAEAIKNAIEKHEDATKRIMKIVDGLRTYSRSSESEDEFEVINLNKASKTTVEMMEELVHKEGVKLEYCSMSENMNCEIPFVKFQQIIVNLVGNAKDALVGVDNPLVKVSLEKKGASSCLKVSDNGCGIRESSLEKIFDSFYTTKEVGKGTGLGLSVVAEIVKSYNGKITVDSKVGEGTTFSVFFPLSDSATVEELPTDEKESSLAKNIEAVKSLVSGKVALIVDDEPDLREIMEENLSDFGLKVLTAGNGKEGLEIIENNEIDFLFSDIQMPVMNGITFMNTVAKENLCSGAKKFFVTGGVNIDFSDSDLDRKQAYEFVDNVLYKPFTEEDLADALKPKELQKVS